MGTVEAKQKCPELVLVSGEDLTPYRQCNWLSQQITCKQVVNDQHCVVQAS